MMQLPDLSLNLKRTQHSPVEGTVPHSRVRTLRDQPLNLDGDFVLYWMVANRRATWNFSLDRAVDWAIELQKPLVIFEALRCGYRWASDRIHQFVIEGMLDNRRVLQDQPVTYLPYLEPTQGAGKGALSWLAQRAAIVVTDDFPCFFIPQMLLAAAAQIPVRMEVVDSNGLWPMRETDRVFHRAFDFRRFLQKNLLVHLNDAPQATPLARPGIPAPIAPPSLFCERWPLLGDRPTISLNDLPIDHSVRPVSETVGGATAAGRRLAQFVNQRLPNYAENRNDPGLPGTSGLSPYLHFGHISVHEIFNAVCQTVGWKSEQVNPKANGSSTGWWGAPEPVEQFLDELITWREIGFNLCVHCDNYDQYESLPIWAQQTLSEHADDPREFVYRPEQFEFARTHDELWNAAQTQLIRTGRIHNYLRMLWGKKILEWSESPRQALDVMVHLNNKYALDGRNPNSYSGIFWVLGRYDRAWGPERPIFGKIRYMSSDNTRRKLNVKDYLRTYGPPDLLSLL